MSEFTIVDGNIKSVKLIDASDLVPESWRSWFWGSMSEDAPFSWGDNNRTLITKERFVDEVLGIMSLARCNDIEIDEEEENKFIDALNELPEDVYIDLEN